MENHEWSTPELQSKAEFYCAHAEHCIADVKEKMRQWNATSEQIEQVLLRLLDGGFIDEQRYCKAFVHDKLLYQSWGRVKIRAALLAKHIPDEIIDKGLADIDEIDYTNILKKVIQKKKGTPEQVIRYCLQRGFTYSEIQSACK